MATTKTIQPTGTTITIPAMTDRPDASVYSTDIDRITDATNALNSNSTYNAGSSIKIQQVFVGKSTNAKDGYFGSIILDKPVASGTTVKLKAGFEQYGAWYSDGASHIVNGSADITAMQVNRHTIWFSIPVSNITATNSIAWIRLDGTIEIS